MTGAALNAGADPACWAWPLPALLVLSDKEAFAFLQWWNHRCAICGDDCPLVLDHDHDSGLVRGYLCHSCNVLEGKALSGTQSVFAKYRSRCPAGMLGIQIAYTSRCAVPAVQTQVPEDPPAELSDLDREFADRLRVSRKRCGLSQEEVARRMQEAGHSTFRQQTVARVERYQRGVYLREMKAFVHAVGSTVEELLPESFMCTEDERETYSIYT